MKRLLLAGAVASATLLGAVSLAPPPAEATHSLRHLIRQVETLENKVATLQQKVKTLSADVYQCEVWDTLAPKTFPDGSVGYPLYLDSRCA